MSFVYPFFLFALATLAVPIIIHLFHFRRFKTVYFTNVRFLREIKEETQSRNKLRNLLVLLMRCLALAFLVLAFAQPFLPGKNQSKNSGRQDVSIYIDNSFSMQAVSEDIPLLEKAKQRALEIVSTYEADDHFQILTTDFEGRDQRLVSKDDALARIGEIKITPSVKEISKVINRQKQALFGGDAKSKTAYVISDFQKSTTDIQTFSDTTFNVQLVALQSVGGRNLSVDSVWFEAPVQMLNQTNNLIIKVHNHGDTDAENVRITLKTDGNEKPSGNMIVPANGDTYDTLGITLLKTGWQEAEVSVSDYPVEFDDRYFFTFNVKEQVKILEVYNAQPNRYVSAAFASNTYFKLNPTSFGKIDYSGLKDYQLIILSDLPSVSSGLASELVTYVRNGGNILVFPAPNADINSYSTLTNPLQANTYTPFDQTARNVSWINFDEFVFRGVFEARRDNMKLPDTKGNFKLGRTANTREEELLRYRDGSTFLCKTVFEKGNVYLCAAPLDANVSTLVQNGEIFVPMLFKMSLSKGQEVPIAYTIGKNTILQTAAHSLGGETNLKLKNNSGEFIPEQRTLGSNTVLNVTNAIKDAGFYDLFLKEGELLDKFAFNYDRKESDLKTFTLEELKAKFGDIVGIMEGTRSADFRSVVGERSRGTALWKWCVILALLFLALEIGIIRLWKE